MRGRLRVQTPEQQGGYCASCGTSLQSTRSSHHRWSIESLLPSGVVIGSNLCSACRQRHMARRIGAVVSARM